ncbi:MAG: hypothetical protein HOB69_06415 [Flavobacterium sp.]|nr:hypothetical protein [Flavobacterium sp.]
MKKKDIIQLVKKVVKENAYGSATLTTQGPPRTGAIAPTDEYPFSKRPKRTGTGMMEAGPSNNPYYNNLVKKAKEMGIHVNDLMKSLLKDKSEMEIVKMGYQDVAALAGVENLDETDAISTARSLRSSEEEGGKPEGYDDIPDRLKEFQQPKSFDPDTIRLVREMLLAADIHHNELVGGYDEVSSYLDKRTGGTIIKFPHFNGPQGRGALFGKETSDQIDSSKAKAKAAALKVYTQFKQYIEDYEISDASPAGVYGNMYLWVMFNELAKDYSAPKGGTQSTQFEMHDFEKKYGDKIKPDDFKNNPKLQPGKTVIYGGTRHKVLENNGYVLTLQSIESDKIKKVNLNQFISQGAIKEKEMKKIKEIGHMVTTKGGDTKYMDVDPKTAQKMKTDPNITDIDTVTGMQVKEEPNEGNAFGLAMQKAKEAGEDSFELDGKTFNVSEVEMEMGAEPKMTNDMGKDNFVDDEGRHAKMQLQKAAEYSVKLAQMMDDMTQLPSWVQSKITKASDYMSAVYHYLDYEMSNSNDNLMENVNKYRKRAVLMEGAMKQFFEMFDRGMTDEEVIQDYAQKGTQIPETFVGRARKQYEGLKKMKLELEMSEKEYKNSATKIVNNPMGMEAGDGMEEEKQLASGLFKENRKIKKK